METKARYALYAAIATLIFVALYARATSFASLKDRSKSFVIPVDIITTYVVGALLFVGLFEQVIHIESVMNHPLLGVSFLLPLLIFMHEIRRDRQYENEAKKYDRMIVFRVSVLVTIAIAATGSLSSSSRVRVAAVALGAASLLFPFSSSLPWTTRGASFETIQRVGLVSSAWLIVGLVGKELLENPQNVKFFKT